MLSLILVIATPFIFRHIKKNRGNLSENFFLCLLIGGCILGFLWGSSASYVYLYDENAEDIKIYKEEIYQLELELNEIEILIENISSRSDFTEKEIELILDGISVKKSELYEQMDLYNGKLDNALHYNNPKILKINKFLIYFG